VSAQAKPLLRAYGELPLAGETTEVRFELPRLRLFLGLFPAGSCSYSGYFNIPARLRPSPLNMIFRDLSLQTPSLDPGRVLFSFMNFDAY